MLLYPYLCRCRCPFIVAILFMITLQLQRKNKGCTANQVCSVSAGSGCIITPFLMNQHKPKGIFIDYNVNDNVKT